MVVVVTLHQAGPCGPGVRFCTWCTPGQDVVVWSCDVAQRVALAWGGCVGRQVSLPACLVSECFGDAASAVWGETDGDFCVCGGRHALGEPLYAFAYALLAVTNVANAQSA